MSNPLHKLPPLRALDYGPLHNLACRILPALLCIHALTSGFTFFIYSLNRRAVPRQYAVGASIAFGILGGIFIFLLLFRYCRVRLAERCGWLLERPGAGKPVPAENERFSMPRDHSDAPVKQHCRGTERERNSHQKYTFNVSAKANRQRALERGNLGGHVTYHQPDRKREVKATLGWSRVYKRAWASIRFSWGSGNGAAKDLERDPKAWDRSSKERWPCNHDDENGPRRLDVGVEDGDYHHHASIRPLSPPRPQMVDIAPETIKPHMSCDASDASDASYAHSISIVVAVNNKQNKVQPSQPRYLRNYNRHSPLYFNTSPVAIEVPFLPQFATPSPHLMHSTYHEVDDVASSQQGFPRRPAPVRTSNKPARRDVGIVGTKDGARSAGDSGGRVGFSVKDEGAWTQRPDGEKKQARI